MPLVWSFTGHSARSRLLVRDLLCSAALPRAPYPCRNVSFVELSCACPSQACLGKDSVAVYKMANRPDTFPHRRDAIANELDPAGPRLRGRQGYPIRLPANESERFGCLQTMPFVLFSTLPMFVTSLS